MLEDQQQQRINMKAYKIDYYQNQHLLDALIAHARDLGYTIDLRRPTGVHKEYPLLSTNEYVDTCTLTCESASVCELISADKFFRIKPEEEALKLTVAQISEKYGCKVEIVEG